MRKTSFSKFSVLFDPSPHDYTWGGFFVKIMKTLTVHKIEIYIYY